MATAYSFRRPAWKDGRKGGDETNFKGWGGADFYLFHWDDHRHGSTIQEFRTQLWWVCAMDRAQFVDHQLEQIQQMVLFLQRHTHSNTARAGSERRSSKLQVASSPSRSNKNWGSDQSLCAPGLPLDALAHRNIVLQGSKWLGQGDKIRYTVSDRVT